MTSFLTSAAVAPLVLALVPCLFSGMKPQGTSANAFVEDTPVLTLSQPAEPETADLAPWWKPAALGIDNYS